MIHKFKDKTRWLSNMTLVNIRYNDCVYKSVEHAYQSAKNDSPLWKSFCLMEDNPYKIKMASKEIEIISNWDEIKLDVMEKCLIEKFTQEPFRTQLIETGNQNIQEGNEWGDKFWGVDLKESPNVGENHLGRLIMKIRDKINNKEL